MKPSGQLALLAGCAPLFYALLYLPDQPNKLGIVALFLAPFFFICFLLRFVISHRGFVATHRFVVIPVFAICVSPILFSSWFYVYYVFGFFRSD